MQLDQNSNYSYIFRTVPNPTHNNSTSQQNPTAKTRPRKPGRENPTAKTRPRKPDRPQTTSTGKILRKNPAAKTRRKNPTAKTRQQIPTAKTRQQKPDSKNPTAKRQQNPTAKPDGKNPTTKTRQQNDGKTRRQNPTAKPDNKNPTAKPIFSMGRQPLYNIVLYYSLFLIFAEKMTVSLFHCIITFSLFIKRIYIT